MNEWIVAAMTVVLTLSGTVRAADGNVVLVEAEGFKDYGGWVLDTQFVHIMGSPYLLAHGLGVPVKDATTTVTLPGAGVYKVFVRTKDWVAQWQAPGQPGRFQLLIDGKPLAATFGTQGADWLWQDGGTVEVTRAQVTLSLHDLTGFEGRCDAIVFSKDPAFVPPDAGQPLAVWRKKTLGLPEQPIDGGTYDLVIVGGGYAGLGSAISAARMGCRVALIQDRPVLGGNGSSEIRVWAQGGTMRGKYPHLGEIVEEFADSAKNSPGTPQEFGDELKEALVRYEKNITLALSTQVFSAETKDGKIIAVIGRNMASGAETRYAGRLFADCTGHGALGAMAGATFDMTEQGHMGMSNMWKWGDAGQPIAFPAVPWALDLSMADFPYPKKGKAEWFWEGGFNRHPINDLEYIRDWNFRAIYGAFNAMKNKDGKDQHANAKLDWVAYIGGPRESRLLHGDLLLTREDIINKIEYPDGCVPTTWSIDLHVPKEQYAEKFPQDPFISKAIFDARVDKTYGYPVPYRCFYSKDLSNLFMAGRCISVDRGALGTIRVMRTGGMMGEVVGKAASICVKHDCTPRDVYASHLEELKDLLKLPGNARRATVDQSIDVNAPRPNLAHDPAQSRHAGPNEGLGINPKMLPGIVVTIDQAKLTGNWTKGTNLPDYIGSHYAHVGPDKNAAGKGAGSRSARFEFTVPEPGRYEVRFAVQPHENRATNAAVTVTSAEGQKAMTIDEREPKSLSQGFVTLGIFRFDPAAPGAVEVTNAGADGLVAVNAVQVLPVK